MPVFTAERSIAAPAGAAWAVPGDADDVAREAEGLRRRSETRT